MKKLIEYLKASKAELMKVVWPSRVQARDHTIMVIAISLAVAAFLGLVDYILEAAVLQNIL